MQIKKPETFEEKIKLLLNSKPDIENKTRITEELAEFSIEISKDIRGQLNKNNLLEEFADVIIELHMAKEIYNISDEEIEKYVNEKMERNLSRLSIKNLFFKEITNYEK